MVEPKKVFRIRYWLLTKEKPLAFAGWFLLAFVAIMQMYKVKGGLLTNYGADVIAPIMLYYLTRINKTFLSKLKKGGLNEIQTFILLWILCLGWEVMQRFDLTGTLLVFTRGRFDPWDIFTYTVTLLICFGIDMTRIREDKRAKSPV